MSSSKWMGFAVCLALAPVAANSQVLLAERNISLNAVSDAGSRFMSNPAFTGFLFLDKVTTLAGGLPIRAGNEVVGAIGISGAPKGEQDAACAQVGIDRIAKGLTG